MKKIFALIVAMMLVVAFSGATFAEEKKAVEAPKAAEAANTAEPAKAEEPAKKAKKASEKVKKVTGEVTAVDAKVNTVTVKGKKGDVTVEVTADTKITAGKETKALADVMAGEKATVKYVEKDGKNTAKSIDVKAAAKKKEVKKEEKKEEPKK